MLSRSKIHNWLYLDDPELIPHREQNLAKRPVWQRYGATWMESLTLDCIL